MTSKERIENAIRHIQTATDIDPWAMEIAVEAMLRMLDADGDIVSRREAIDALCKICDRPKHPDWVYTDEFCRALGALPSAQPERKWIPAWQEYPQDNRFVLVCNDDGRCAIAQYIGHEVDAYHPWQIAYCPYDVDIWDEDEHGKIMAWMDLPKPYKEGENTNDEKGSLRVFERLRIRILRREYGQNTTAQLRPDQRNNVHTGKSVTEAD